MQQSRRAMRADRQQRIALGEYASAHDGKLATRTKHERSANGLRKSCGPPPGFHLRPAERSVERCEPSSAESRCSAARWARSSAGGDTCSQSYLRACRGSPGVRWAMGVAAGSREYRRAQVPRAKPPMAKSGKAAIAERAFGLLWERPKASGAAKGFGRRGRMHTLRRAARSACPSCIPAAPAAPCAPAPAQSHGFLRSLLRSLDAPCLVISRTPVPCDVPRFARVRWAPHAPHPIAHPSSHSTVAPKFHGGGPHSCRLAAVTN